MFYAVYKRLDKDCMFKLIFFRLRLFHFAPMERSLEVLSFELNFP